MSRRICRCGLGTRETLLEFTLGRTGEDALHTQLEPITLQKQPCWCGQNGDFILATEIRMSVSRRCLAIGEFEAALDSEPVVYHAGGMRISADKVLNKCQARCG